MLKRSKGPQTPLTDHSLESDLSVLTGEMRHPQPLALGVQPSRRTTA